MNPRAVIVAVGLSLVPLFSASQNINYLRLALASQQERMQDLDIYVVRIRGNEIPGLRLGLPDGAQGACLAECVVYKVETVQGPDGMARRQERALSPLEVATLAGQTPGADFVETYGQSLIGFQQIFNANTGGESAASINAGLANRDWENDESRAPWLNPHRMFHAGGVMMLETADAMRDAERSLATSAAQAQAEANQTAAVVAQLEELGVETLESGAATRYGAVGINIPMATDNGVNAFMTGASLWVDNDEYVIVAHRIDGTMAQNGESRPFFLEVRNSDFRAVPGCDLYEPYRRVMRMGGVLDDAQMAEMQEAVRKLDEFEAQLAAMPANQRSMMENMIGSQMATLRSMASGGAFEHVQEIEEIICNPDLTALFSATGSAALSVTGPPAVDLAQIQRHLVTLGYAPGNTEGVLDTLTEIAISQFQAERNIAVTGQPSAQLAAALAAEVAKQP